VVQANVETLGGLPRHILSGTLCRIDPIESVLAHARLAGGSQRVEFPRDEVRHRRDAMWVALTSANIGGVEGGVVPSKAGNPPQSLGEIENRVATGGRPAGESGL